MGDAMYGVKTTEEHRFVLRAPTPACEVMKAVNWAHQKFAEHRGRPVEFDDDIMIDGDEEEIVVFFRVET